MSKLLVTVGLSASLAVGLGCDSGSKAELDAARAELADAQAELERSAERLDEATVELKAARQALEMIVQTSTTGVLNALDAMDTGEAAGAPSTESIYTVDRALVREPLESSEALLEQARIVPAISDGVTEGFKLYGIRSGSVPKLFGLKNGDMVKAVNGSSVGTVEEAMSAYTTHRDKTKFTIDIIRKGKPLVLTVELVEGGEAPAPE